MLKTMAKTSVLKSTSAVRLFVCVFLERYAKGTQTQRHDKTKCCIRVKSVGRDAITNHVHNQVKRIFYVIHVPIFILLCICWCESVLHRNKLYSSQLNMLVNRALFLSIALYVSCYFEK